MDLFIFLHAFLFVYLFRYFSNKCQHNHSLDWQWCAWLLLCLKKLQRQYFHHMFQWINVVLFMTCAIYWWITNIWLVFILILWEGVLGGAAYVNTFYKISQEVSLVCLTWEHFFSSSLSSICLHNLSTGFLNVACAWYNSIIPTDNKNEATTSPHTLYNLLQTDERHKEFAMGVTTLADSTGVTMAGLIAIPLHNIICGLPVKWGKDASSVSWKGNMATPCKCYKHWSAFILFLLHIIRLIFLESDLDDWLWHRGCFDSLSVVFVFAFIWCVSHTVWGVECKQTLDCMICFHNLSHNIFYGILLCVMA